MSKAFYEKLGFAAVMGDESQNWLILKNGACTIGLFEKNVLTFNPGWDTDAKQLGAFTEVRALQRQAKDRGISLISKADEASAKAAPANCCRTASSATLPR